MKKFTAIICTLALLTAFTGCDNGETSVSASESESSVSTAEITSNDTSSSESTPDSSESLPESTESLPESSSDSVPEPKFTDEQLEIIAKYGILNFVAPDGETVQVTDAAEIFDTRDPHDEIGSPGFKFDSKSSTSTVLRYDFAYIRYCRPFFYEGEFLDAAEEQKMIDELPEIKWFKVKAGDKLDCGLTVKKAVFERFPIDTSDPVRDNYIEFDGEVTLEGMLWAVKRDDYLLKTNDLSFMPDPTKTNGIPACKRQLDPSGGLQSMMSSDGNYVLSDIGTNWIVGTIDDIDMDEIFGEKDLVRVKITLTNVKWGGIVSVDLPAFYAEIVDIERIDE